MGQGCKPRQGWSALLKKWPALQQSLQWKLSLNRDVGNGTWRLETATESGGCYIAATQEQLDCASHRSYRSKAAWWQIQSVRGENASQTSCTADRFGTAG